MKLAKPKMPKSQLKRLKSEMNIVMKSILENVLNNSILLMAILTFGFAELLHKSESSTSATIKTSTSFELSSSKARVISIKFTKQESVS